MSQSIKVATDYLYQWDNGYIDYIYIDYINIDPMDISSRLYIIYQWGMDDHG